MYHFILPGVYTTRAHSYYNNEQVYGNIMIKQMHVRLARAYNHSCPNEPLHLLYPRTCLLVTQRFLAVITARNSLAVEVFQTWRSPPVILVSLSATAPMHCAVKYVLYGSGPE